MYIWTCMYLLALQHSEIYLLREKRTCHSGNTTTHVICLSLQKFFLSSSPWNNLCVTIYLYDGSFGNDS